MKRLLLVALLGLFLVPDQAHAQRRRGRATPIRMGLTFGIKAGGAYTNMANYVQPPNGIVKTYDGRFNLVGGGLVNYRFTQQLSLQLEALYAPRGTDQLEESSPRRETIFKLGYVDIPLMLKFNAKIFYIEAGGVGSLLTSANSETIAPKKNERVIGLDALDAGYAIGIGIEVPNGAFGGVRYVRSSGSIGAGGALVGNQDLENSSVQITAGFIFNHSGSGGRRRR